MADRTIIIGDVHGCHNELAELLQLITVDRSCDRIYFTGDLINRGPSSKAVLDIYHDIEGTAVLGNHEEKVLKQVDGTLPCDKQFDAIERQFGSGFPSFIDTIKTWPTYIDSPSFLLVHAGILPGIPLDRTPDDVFTKIKTWDGKSLKVENKRWPAWFNYYTADQLIVFGHWSQIHGVFRSNTIGLDTGCVHGHFLTALVLPEKRLFMTPAHRVYWPEPRKLTKKWYV